MIVQEKRSSGLQLLLRYRGTALTWMRGRSLVPTMLAIAVTFVDTVHRVIAHVHAFEHHLRDQNRMADHW